jgi:lysophospholipase L1-like esterase
MSKVLGLARIGGVALLGVATTGLFLAPARSAPAEPQRRPAVLWVGDSYAAGVGSSKGVGYPELVCARLTWDCTVDAQGGTGFVANGHNNSPDFVPFVDRLEEDAARVTPDLVLIDGGRNDEREPPMTLVTAASAYVAQLRATYPEARFVFVVPTFLKPQTVNEARIGRVLAQLADQQNGELIDPGGLEWVRSEAQGRSLIARDGVHPNDAGHAFVADRLVDALKACGLA